MIIIIIVVLLQFNNGIHTLYDCMCMTCVSYLSSSFDPPLLLIPLPPLLVYLYLLSAIAPLFVNCDT